MAYEPGSGQMALPPDETLNGKGKGKSVIKERVKSLAYSATDNKLLLDVETATTESSVKEGIVGDINIENTGKHPAFAILAYRRWTDATTMSSDTYHLNYLLKPKENLYLPDTPAVISDETVEQLTGTAVTNSAPDSNEYTDSGDNVASGELNNTTDPVVFELDNGHEKYRVGDLIRCENEIMRVEGTYDNNPTSSTVADNHIVVSRGHYGSTNASHSGTPDIRFPFFNAYHDYDKYSVAQTDNSGRFKCFNMFGQGRGATALQGITPGSFALKFYEAGYQSLGLSGITAGTHSGLTASTEYKLDITVDGGSLFQDLTFTLSSNTKFGGSDGVIRKIQDALDVQYYTAGNLFEKKVTVGIVNGDIRFTSGSHLSTSAILLADTGDSGSFIDATANGRIPASDDIEDAVAARLPNDTVLDRKSGVQSANLGSMFYDDGHGNINGVCSGTIDYKTGAMDLNGCPPDAEFVVSASYGSAHSGENRYDTTAGNSIMQISGRSANNKIYTTIEVTALR